jgi:hypothetical protein
VTFRRLTFSEIVFKLRLFAVLEREAIVLSVIQLNDILPNVLAPMVISLFCDQCV